MGITKDQSNLNSLQAKITHNPYRSSSMLQKRMDRVHISDEDWPLWKDGGEHLREEEDKERSKIREREREIEDQRSERDQPPLMAEAT